MTIGYLFLHVFFFNDTATTEIYTLSLHDALPISGHGNGGRYAGQQGEARCRSPAGDRKSTRLNSSHSSSSYAVFCLKKKNPTLGCDHSPDYIYLCLPTRTKHKCS